MRAQRLLNLRNIVIMFVILILKVRVIIFVIVIIVTILPKVYTGNHNTNNIHNSIF